MIVTTTPTVEGKTIKEYKGIVFGEVISGVDFLKDMAAGFRNFFGGRSQAYEGAQGASNPRGLRWQEHTHLKERGNKRTRCRI